MTDRISNLPGTAGVPRLQASAAVKAAAAAVQGASTTSDVFDVLAKATLPTGGLLPVAPVLAPAVQDAVDWVDHGFKSLGHELSHAWHSFTHLLARSVPYGFGVKLHVKHQDQYESALSRYWLNVRDDHGKLPLSTDELEREVQQELAREHAAPQPHVSLGWKGWEPDEETTRRFVRQTARELADGAKAFDPGEELRRTLVSGEDELARKLPKGRHLTPQERSDAARQTLLSDQAIHITKRVLTASQEARRTLYEATPDRTARELADTGVELMAQAARGVFVSRAVAYAHLAPADRQRAEALRRQFESSPRVQEAIDGMVQNGRLFAKDLAGGQSTLDHLEALAHQPLIKEVADHRLETLGETIMEIAQPGSISQRGRNTCGAASAQGILAQESPAEYVRLVVGLASPAGTVKTTTGTELKRNERWFVDDTAGARSVPSRLLQSSFMEISSNGSYDNDLDRGRWPGLFDWVGKHAHLLDGSYPGGEVALLHAVTGRDFYSEWNGAFEGKGEGLKEASRAHPVAVLMNYNDKDGGESLHWVRVIGYDAEKDEYTVLNARARNQDTDAGTEDVVGGADFRKHHVAIVHEGVSPTRMVQA